jgi:predicted acyltransferase
MNASPVTAPPSGNARIMSIDALRGFDMFWIIGADGLVEALDKFSPNPAVNLVAKELTHKEWAGFAFEDLIFPLFVFLAGVSLVFSLTKIVQQEGRPAAVQRVFKRFLALYILGIFYYGGFANLWPGIRLVGVLQRIALAYFFASLLVLYVPPKGLVAVAAGLLLGYWALMALVPLPGVAAADRYAEGKNLANAIDFNYLPGRKWDKTHDPEGLLSTLPAIASCLLGVFAGLLIKCKETAAEKKVVILLAAGVVSVAAGFGWGLWFPVVKKIWTSSFVLVAGGYSAMLLGAFYWVIDVKNWRLWARPFVWIGLNPITIYLAENMIPFGKWSERFVGGNVAAFLDHHVAQGLGGLVIALFALGLIWFLAWFLYKRKIFLRL